jgi:hypothetical protein
MVVLAVLSISAPYTQDPVTVVVIALFGDVVEEVAVAPVWVEAAPVRTRTASRVGEVLAVPVAVTVIEPGALDRYVYQMSAQPSPLVLMRAARVQVWLPLSVTVPVVVPDPPLPNAQQATSKLLAGGLKLAEVAEVADACFAAGVEASSAMATSHLCLSVR